jgi:hypothetical protein
MVHNNEISIIFQIPLNTIRILYWIHLLFPKNAKNYPIFHHFSVFHLFMIFIDTVMQTRESQNIFNLFYKVKVNIISCWKIVKISSEFQCYLYLRNTVKEGKLACPCENFAQHRFFFCLGKVCSLLYTFYFKTKALNRNYFEYASPWN